MKYAFMTFSTPELDLDAVLALAAELGYDGVEPRLDAGHAHGVEVAADAAERQRIADAFRRGGVAPACLATSCRLASPDETERMIADAHERIDLAGDVGAGCLRVFGGQIGEDSREAAIDRMTASMSALADHAGERGVRLAFETHDAWCDPRHVAEVLERVNHPAVGANWDILHPLRHGLATIDESFELLKPWIAHLHIHDGRAVDDRLEMLPIGTGDVDHRRTIELLKTIDFDGFLSGEWINWEPHETHLPREIDTLRKLEARIDA